MQNVKKGNLSLTKETSPTDQDLVLTAAEVSLLRLAVRVRAEEAQAIEEAAKRQDEASAVRYAEAVGCIWDSHQVTKDYQVELHGDTAVLVPPKPAAE